MEIDNGRSIDRRPFYVWMVVVLANLGLVSFLIVAQTKHLRGFSFTNFIAVAKYIVPGFLAVSIIPVLISKIRNRLSILLGYGIPVILTLPLPYYFWHMYTCTEKFCGLWDSVMIDILGAAALTFALFYTIARYAKRWNVKFAKSLVWVVLLIIIVADCWLVWPR